MKKRFTRRADHWFPAQGGGRLAGQELCRQHGFSEASYYLWRSKFGGMSVSDAKRLKELEAENNRLKKGLAKSRHGYGRHGYRHGQNISFSITSVHASGTAYRSARI